MGSLLKCTTSLCLKLFLETMLVSTSRTSQLRISREVMLPLIPRTSLQLEFKISLPRLLFLTTQDKFLMDTVLSLIVTLPTLLASLLRSRRRLTVVLVNLLKTTPSSSSLEMQLLYSWCQASPCALRPSLNIHHLEALLSESLSLQPPRLLKASRPRLPRRLLRRNEMASRGNMSQLTSSNVLNPGVRNSGNFLFTVVFLKLACTSLAKSFAGYSLHCHLFSCPNA